MTPKHSSRGLALAFLLSAMTSGAALADGGACQTVRLSDPGWTDINATNGVASVMLSALGYTPDVKTLSVPIGFESLKNKDIDAFLGNWMPAQQHFIDDLDKAGAIEVLNRNLTGAKFTLAVPDYMAARGVKDFADLAAHGDDFDHKIYGIDSGSAANQIIQKMIDENAFGLKGWDLVESSEQAMLAQVDRAVKAHKGVVFLAWAPHPMNVQYHIDYLPGGDTYFGPNFGGAEVYTVARKGWATECPNAGTLLRQMTFSVDMENALMVDILGGSDPKDAAKTWLKAHPDTLTPWLAGVTTLDGKPAEPAVKKALGL